MLVKLVRNTILNKTMHFCLLYRYNASRHFQKPYVVKTNAKLHSTVNILTSLGKHILLQI